ncbi:MAG: nucleoside-diphosphate kinase [Candidatus Gracilibacteria bacterium]|nr:nucleoside-diphosphate kinase [Candidatus Gracilibacteria bacterium]
MPSIEKSLHQTFRETNNSAKEIDSKIINPIGRDNLSRVRKKVVRDGIETSRILVELLDTEDIRAKAKDIILVPDKIALRLVLEQVTNMLAALASPSFTEAVNKGYVTYAAVKPLMDSPWEQHALDEHRPPEIQRWFKAPISLPADPHDREDIGANWIMTHIVAESGLELLTSISLAPSKKDMQVMYGHLLEKNSDFLTKVYGELQKLLTNGPLTPFLLVGENALDKWREITGPEQDPDKSSPEHFRYTFSTKYHSKLHKDIVVNNGVHGSRPEIKGSDRYADLKNDLGNFKSFLMKLKETCKTLLSLEV